MIRLHHVPFSRSFRVLWLMTEMGLEFEVEEYSIRDGSLRDPKMMSISPAGRVPGLEIDGITVFESGAIVEYLCETRPEAGMAPAPGEPERARYLQILHFSETMAALLEQLNLSQVFLRDPAQQSPVVTKLNTRRLEGTLRALDAMLGARAYLLDRGFSAADAMMGFNLFSAPYYVRFDDLPGLSAYRDRLAARPGYVAARARDGAQDFYTRDFYPVPGET